MRRTITPEWIAHVRKAMAAQGLSQNAVGAKVGSTSAAMSLILSGEQQSSKLVEPISRLLKVDLPSLSLRDPQIETLASVCADLEPDDISVLLAMADRMKSHK